MFRIKFCGSFYDRLIFSSEKRAICVLMRKRIRSRKPYIIILRVYIYPRCSSCSSILCVISSELRIYIDLRSSCHNKYKIRVCVQFPENPKLLYKTERERRERVRQTWQKVDRIDRPCTYTYREILIRENGGRIRNVILLPNPWACVCVCAWALQYKLSGIKILYDRPRAVPGVFISDMTRASDYRTNLLPMPSREAL